VSGRVTADPSRYFRTPRGERAQNRLRLVDTSRHTCLPFFCDVVPTPAQDTNVDSNRRADLSDLGFRFGGREK
jgi:hypothetical protein